MILFGRSMTVTPVENNAIPVYYFAFAPYSKLKTRLVDKNKLLTDFIGRYISAKEIVGHSRKGPLRIRLQHESGKLIDVALWEEIARSFNQSAAGTDPDPAIIEVTSLKVSTFGGALQLASTSITEVYINPCIAQLPTLIQRFKHLPPSEVASLPSRNKVAESNLTLLSEILNQLEETKKIMSSSVSGAHGGDDVGQDPHGHVCTGVSCS